MSTYAATYDRQAAPDKWVTDTYTVRRPGCTAWETGIASCEAARREAREANRVCSPGHHVYAEQHYYGEPQRRRTIDCGLHQ